MKNILLLEDLPEIRAWLKVLINQVFPDAQISESARVHDALGLVSALKFDLALVDIFMPTLDGLEALQRALELSPGAKIVIMTGNIEPEFLNLAIARGAVGYVSKNDDFLNIIQTLKTAHKGGKALSPRSQQIVFDAATAMSNPLEVLTRRELEIDPGFLPRADLYFEPGVLPPEAERPTFLRVLYQMVPAPCVFEVETHPPSKDHMLDLHFKQMGVRNRRQHQGQGSVLPYLWTLTCGRPVGAFKELGVQAAPEFPRGFYHVPMSWVRMGIVVLPELPKARETLVLRLMGTAQQQAEALAEVQALPLSDPEHLALRRLLGGLRHVIQGDKLLPREEKEAFMTAGRAEVLSLEAEAWEKGFKIGIKLATYFELLADAWTGRFGAPVEAALAARLAAVENPRVLRQAFALVIRATDAATATREVEELLARY